MAMSAAERARKYRERINSDPEKRAAYLNKEKLRNKKKKENGIIKPISELSSRSQRNQRRRWRKNQQNVREKQQKQKSLTQNLLTPPGSPMGEAVGRAGRDQDRRATCGRRKVHRMRSAAYREILKLRVQLSNTRRQKEKYRKQIYRLKTAAKFKDSPQKKTQELLKGQKVSSKVRKTLLFHNVVIKAIRVKYQSTSPEKQKQLFSQMFSEAILNKYRFKSNAAASLSFSRKRFKNNRTKGPIKYKRKKRANSFAGALKATILQFFVRDDNSRTTSGRKDTITKLKVKHQKRYLNDTLKNLHTKFLSENPKVKVSYSLFASLRPFYVLIPRASDRETCICKIHDNLQLKADKLCQLGVLGTSDIMKIAAEICCSVEDKKCMFRECLECCRNKIQKRSFDEGSQIFWYEWQRRVETREKVTAGTKETIDVQLTRKEKVMGTVATLVDDFEKSLKVSCRHLYTVSHQYLAIHGLKKKLNMNECIIHLDFSENYACKYASEIQSVHFGSSHQQASLHTGLVYTHEKYDNLPFCTISPSFRHDPPSIWAHMRPIFIHIKGKYPDINTVHFVSDGPTTQYKQKKNFTMFVNRLYTYGFVKATWNYLAAGHGKGPADGIGAVVKRTADRLVSHGKDIPDAKTLFDTLHGETSVCLFFISPKDIEEEDKYIPPDITVIPGTMKIHQMSTSEKGALNYRALSCFCSYPDQCACHSPVTVQVQYQDPNSSVQALDSTSPNTNTQSGLTDIGDITADLHGKWCVVTYDGLPYPGIIQDTGENEIEVMVMHRVGDNRFFWPSLMDDILWYRRDDIITLIPPPTPVTKRHHQIDKLTWKAIAEKLDL